MKAKSLVNPIRLTGRFLKPIIVIGVIAAIMTTGLFWARHAPNLAGASAPAASLLTSQAASLHYARLPLSFAPVEQPTQGKFMARGAGYAVALEPTQATFLLKSKTTRQPRTSLHDKRLQPRLASGKQTELRLQMHLAGANPTAVAEALERLPWEANYFRGNNPTQWRRNVAQYAKVKYSQVYPGIDLIYYGTGQQLEYDFVVAPGTTPQAIQLEFAGAEKIAINSAGELVLEANASQLVQHKPVIYQEANGQRQSVEGGYVELGENRIGFRVGDYDHTLPLVIDPVLSYSTYLGGNGVDYAFFLALDEAGNVYVQGNTTSTDFPSSPGQTPPGGSDVFIAKLNPTQSTPVFITYLGGTGEDYTGGIAVDRRGNIYLGGNTTSTDFPTRDAIQPNYGGDKGIGYGDAYVAKLAPSGAEIIYATYLGGSSDDSSSGIALDRAGNVYVTGLTLSPDFPTRRAAQAQYGGGNTTSGVGLFGDAFIAKINPAGSALVYSTYLGGSADDGATNIALDAEGAVYISGATGSSDLPVVKAFQPQYGGAGPINAGDGFLAKLAPSGRRFEYVTYLGGTSDEEAWSVGVDTEGSAYVVGGTGSTDFPLQRALQRDYGGIQPGNGVAFGDAFVTKFQPDGRRLEFSTFLGGSGNEVATGLFVDVSGHVYVCGQTTSRNFPTMNPVQAQNAGGDFFGDGFVTELSAAGNRLLFSTYLGGSIDDWAWTLKANRLGDIFLAGFTYSTDFPTTPQAAQKYKGIGGDNDAFIAKIDNRADCHSVCLYAPEYWLSHPNRIPNGVVYLDQFFAVPTSSPVVRAALLGGYTPAQKLRAEFVAYQLSLLTTPFPQLIEAQSLGCLGTPFLPLTVSNGDVIDVDMKGNEFFLQIQEALRRFNQNDMRDLTLLLNRLHGRGLGGCGRED